MNNKTDIEEDIKILYEITKGDEDCLRIDLANNNTEDIEHWKREIEAIKKVVNTYYKEKARANKLEKEYSKMLTKIDEYEADDRANKYDSLVENIKETIFELKEIRKTKYDRAYGLNFESREQQDIDKQIGVLQELLKGE